ncbi:hypothetical protein V8J36_22660 [Frigidibacter sp. MR17.14]|uniref:hypothetical protein n=1 Tax=Frigidibacter sp. MR17.14 TaxID=3126509 RepID=UPI003012B416
MKPEKSETAAEVDLFGCPLEPIRDRRGRRSFKKDAENQRFVAVRVSDGWSQKRIAENMGIDEKTLRKHFSCELELGLTQVRGEFLDVLMRKAREGHVPSIRLLDEWFRDKAPPAPRRAAGEEGDSEGEDDGEGAATSERPGKKEQARIDAQKMPDDYGDIFARMKGRAQ